MNDLAASVRGIRNELDAAIARVLDRGWFVLGPEGEAFEQAFAAYHGPGQQCVGVASGTDALRIALQSVGVEAGDDVLVVANAGVPPVAAVVAAGARPVFCDVDPHTHGLDPAQIDARLTSRTRAVLMVHLYGRTASIADVVERARARDLAVVEDCAQAHGARFRGRLAGTCGDAAAFSFYPTKNLGALGDGGAVLSDKADVVDRARLLRNYGWREQYSSELHSTNSRLDDLQAAILATKLGHLDEWNAARRRLAASYSEVMAGLPGITLNKPDADREDVHHLFVIRVSQGRDQLRQYLREHGVGSGVHYPVPAHLQAPYVGFGHGEGSLPVTEQLAREVLSLPLYPELTSEDLLYVAGQVRAFVSRGT